MLILLLPCIFFAIVDSLDSKWIEYLCNVYLEADLAYRAKKIIHHVNEKAPVAIKLQNIIIKDESSISLISSIQKRMGDGVFKAIEDKNLEEANLQFTLSYKPSMKDYDRLKLMIAILQYDMNYSDNCIHPWDISKKLNVKEKFKLISYIQDHYRHEKASLPFDKKCQNIETFLGKKMNKMECIRVLVASGDIHGLDEQITSISDLDLLTKLRGCLKQKILSSCKTKNFYNKSSVLKLSNSTRAYITKIKPVLENRCTWEEAVFKFRQTCLHDDFSRQSSILPGKEIQNLKQLYCNVNSTNACTISDKINSIVIRENPTVENFLTEIKFNVQSLCKSSNYYYLKDSDTKEEIFHLSFNWSDLFHKSSPPKPLLSLELERKGNTSQTKRKEAIEVSIKNENDSLGEIFKELYL